MTLALIRLIDLAELAILVLIFARIILSFVRIGSYELQAWVFRLTEPLLAPIRRILPPTAGLDFSPLILLLGVQLLGGLLKRIVIGF